MTNDYEHLLISLTFINGESKLGLVCTPTVFVMGYLRRRLIES